jgi:hypothetical protein
VHITRKFWSPNFCGSYAPLNFKISRNILLKQLVSTTPLNLLNRISWNLVGSKDTICSCADRFLYIYIYIQVYGIYIQVSVRDITLECLQITPTKFRGSKFPGIMHNYIWCPHNLPSFMKFCSVVSEELCWQAASEVYFGKFLSSNTVYIYMYKNLS